MTTTATCQCPAAPNQWTEGITCSTCGLPLRTVLVSDAEELTLPMRLDEMTREDNPEGRGLAGTADLPNLWAQARGELLGMATHLRRSNASITGMQVCLAVELADRAMQRAGWQYVHDRERELIGRDGWMCEQHPGLEWPHDDGFTGPPCAGPGMAWKIEGKDAIRALVGRTK
jgi:hypothetical protein